MQCAVIHYAGLVIAVRQDQVADFASIVEAFTRSGRSAWVPIPQTNPIGAVRLWVGPDGEPAAIRTGGATASRAAALRFSELAADALRDGRISTTVAPTLGSVFRDTPGTLESAFRETSGS